jgi:hypothetical protein
MAPRLTVRVGSLLSVAFAVFVVFGVGCTTCERSAGRQFVIGKDNYAFANQLKWIYEFREDGSFTPRPVEPAPENPHRCFPIARSVREVFYHARFDPTLPKVDEKEYRHAVKQIFARNSRCPSAPEDRIVIPGYPDLFAFSSEHENLLQDEVGGSWRSYYQRGNWRMIFPITNRRERKTARELHDEVQAGRLPIIHIYRFPDVRLNHGILIHSAEQRGNEIIFVAYDPNNPKRSAELKFDFAQDAFIFERNQYFAGGPIKVYEVYRGCVY